MDGQVPSTQLSYKYNNTSETDLSNLLLGSKLVMFSFSVFVTEQFVTITGDV